jgi:hypothetical protein
MSDLNQQTDETLNLFQKNPSLNLKRGSFTSWRGNKYPNVKLRGYYSDVTSVQNADRVNVSF